jgi:hypothetical protein
MIHIQPSKVNIQLFKILKFLHFFLWVIFALLDPDPADQNQCGSGFETLQYQLFLPNCHKKIFWNN